MVNLIELEKARAAKSELDRIKALEDEASNLALLEQQYRQEQQLELIQVQSDEAKTVLQTQAEKYLTIKATNDLELSEAITNLAEVLSRRKLLSDDYDTLLRLGATATRDQLTNDELTYSSTYLTDRQRSLAMEAVNNLVGSKLTYSHTHLSETERELVIQLAELGYLVDATQAMDRSLAREALERKLYEATRGNWISNGQTVIRPVQPRVNPDYEDAQFRRR